MQRRKKKVAKHAMPSTGGFFSAGKAFGTGRPAKHAMPSENHSMQVAAPLLALLLTAGTTVCWTTEAHAATAQSFANNAPQVADAVRTNAHPELHFSFVDATSANRSTADAMMFAASAPAVTAQASGLYVDGKFIGAVSDAAHLQNLLNEQLANAQTMTGCQNAAFLNRVEIRTGKYNKTDIVTDDAMALLVSGVTQPTKSYTVANKDTADLIAKKNKMTVKRLEQVNPGVDLKKLHPGDVIQLEPPKNLLSVHTERTEDVVTAVTHKKQVVKTADLVVGQQVTKTHGTDGKLSTSYDVTWVNGIETARQAVAAKQTQAPVTEVVLQGTRLRPSTAGVATGYFLWPTPTLTQITSGYGPRWGTFHHGLDLSGDNAMGQPICAADGGTVLFAGSDNSGYGTYVILDHGNGFISIYGHTSKLLVKQGAKVAQGQLIALVGSTGDSTGPHCHFEVHKDGERIDPTKLLALDITKEDSYTGHKLAAEQVQGLVKAAKETYKISCVDYQKALKETNEQIEDKTYKVTDEH